MISSLEQYPLHLPAAQLTALVDSSVLRALRGIDADSIYSRVDSGEFKWVWDISKNKLRKTKRKIEIRELRFWMREIVAPQTTYKLELDEVLAQILPPEQRCMRSGDISKILLISRPTLMRMRRELRGEVVGGALQVNRSWLLTFLRRRWLGHFREFTFNPQFKNTNN